MMVEVLYFSVLHDAAMRGVLSLRASLHNVRIIIITAAGLHCFPFNLLCAMWPGMLQQA